MACTFYAVYFRPHRYAKDKMRPLAVVVCVCLLDKTASPTKKAEPFQMPFGLWTQVGPRNHALGEGPDPPRRGILGDMYRPIVKYSCRELRWAAEKTDDPIDMQFGMKTRVGLTEPRVKLRPGSPRGRGNFGGCSPPRMQRQCRKRLYKLCNIHEHELC